MPSIHSSAFSKNMGATTATDSPKLREFTVGEPDDMPPSGSNFEPQSLPAGYELSPAEREELVRLRKERFAGGVPKIGDHAKKRIEILANIGRLTKTVEIEGISFSLRTLKLKEAREATLFAVSSSATNVEVGFEIRRQTLARSIFQIDGQDVETALGGTDFNLRLQLIDDMEDTIFDKLYSEFDMLRKEVQTKYGIANEQQAKEVVEDLKK